MGKFETQWPGGNYYTTYYEFLTAPKGQMGNAYYETLNVQGPDLAIEIWSTLDYPITVRLAVYATC